MKQTIFTLTSARSGTVYLQQIVRKNAADCACRHEPFFDWGNPTLFGRAIEEALAGRLDRIRALLVKKRGYVGRLPGSVYLESSHAFLKSAYVAALEVFPDMRLIHLIRDPVKVAVSEAYREMWRRRVHAPFHYYTGTDGRPHFVWALTGNEEIFKSFDGEDLSLTQWYFIQWIEIENRAMRFLDEHSLHERCFTVQTPDLNSPETVRQMFDFFGLKMRRPNIVLAARKNRSIGRRKAVVTERNRAECKAVLDRLPARYLEIFRREPYTRFNWNTFLIEPKAREAAPVREPFHSSSAARA